MDVICLTFTGIDEKTDLDKLIELSRYNSRNFCLEFAVLWSHDRAGKDPRYPSLDFIRGLPQKMEGINNRISIHVCGSDATLLTTEADTDIPYKDFKRCQVNLPSMDSNQLIQLARRAHVSGTKFIVQSRFDTLPWYPGLQVLHDRSGGRGAVESVWPELSQHYTYLDSVGFSGGLSAETIAQAYRDIGSKLSKVDPMIWLDLETNIRTDNWFDLDKCVATADALHMEMTK